MLLQTLDIVLMRLMILVNRELHHTVFFIHSCPSEPCPTGTSPWFLLLILLKEWPSLRYAHSAPLSKSYCSWYLENLNGPYLGCSCTYFTKAPFWGYLEKNISMNHCVWYSNPSPLLFNPTSYLKTLSSTQDARVKSLMRLRSRHNAYPLMNGIWTTLNVNF